MLIKILHVYKNFSQVKSFTCQRRKRGHKKVSNLNSIGSLRYFLYYNPLVSTCSTFRLETLWKVRRRTRPLGIITLVHLFGPYRRTDYFVLSVQRVRLLVGWTSEYLLRTHSGLLWSFYRSFWVMFIGRFESYFCGSVLGF